MHPFTLMTVLHTLGVLSVNSMRKSRWMLFQQSWRRFQRCWALVGCFAFALWSKPSQLGLGRVTVDARSSDAALHHLPSWSDNQYKGLAVCLGSLSCWKTNDGPAKRKPAGVAGRGRVLWLPCWFSVPWILNKSLTVSPAEQHYSSSFMLHDGSQDMVGRAKISNLDRFSLVKCPFTVHGPSTLLSLVFLPQ